ncbi:hypothetical protein GCM10011403_03770 [Pseudohongiella nitratireducens]|uniref:Uncharacterized protein n=1 Tax=Pseudohongiella nitratireducens TaxID=1768907 RepID=A0A917GL60_9GAMM|nr:hypothetical protein [Pseudohongiella nitratireducens]MDF1622881.1 hypothetical protein [Pseudohongiella nitratireducens]GGG49897.1 hypothetical protein GCM10011403_03770 [Pseudohongiella nitratireducens]|tara:strand:+ start:993 stop:1286 length:294 start_codon:yes stop_codon:yes gene_type:complete
MELEYKVIQATTPYFGKLENLQQVLEEEEESGWELVEKLDNYKIRVQRHISHRSDDRNRSRDPYRTQVGPSNAITYTAAAIGTIAVVLLVFKLVGAF